MTGKPLHALADAHHRASPVAASAPAIDDKEGRHQNREKRNPQPLQSRLRARGFKHPRGERLTRCIEQDGEPEPYQPSAQRPGHDRIQPNNHAITREHNFNEAALRSHR